MLPKDFSLPKQTGNFLQLFPDTVYTYIPDFNKDKPVIHSENLQLERQAEGYGIFFSVNGFYGADRKSKNLKSLNAFFCDIDYPDKLNRTPDSVREYKNELIMELTDFDLLPTAIVETKNGLHVYWCLSEPLKIEDIPEGKRQGVILDYLKVVENILLKFDGDPGAKDLSRVLRVPGTYHQKDEKDPFECKLIHFNNEMLYTYNEIRNKFAEVTFGDEWAETNIDNTFTPEVKAEVQKQYPKLERPSFKTLLDKEAVIPEGMRNKALLIAASAMKQSGKTIDEAFQYFNEYHGLSLREIRTTIKSAFSNNYDFGYNNEVVSQFVEPEEKQQFQKVAQKALGNSGKQKEKTASSWQKELYQTYEYLIADRYPHLKYKLNGDFYQYEGGVYKLLSLEQVRNMLFREMMKDGLTNYRRTSAINDKIAAFKSLPGRTFEHHEADPDPQIINLKNGLLHIGTYQLYAHSPDYLSTTQLPHEFDAAAKAVRWNQFIFEVTSEDAGQARLLRQIAGYCLTTSTSFAKAFILFGSGGNGKSMFTRIISKLVGKGNVSNLNLNDISRQFGLIGMVGKKVNIIDEISGNYFESNTIKTIISGESMMIDVKYRPEPLEFTPTAKIIFSVNELPKINDTTPGIYRRFCIIPFTRSFIESPDLNLEPKLEAELAGILNWAIEGLKDLQEVGRFSETAINTQALRNFKQENSPLLEFLHENYEPDPTKDNAYVVQADKLYQEYHQFCRNRGYTPKSQGRFLRELMDARYEDYDHITKEVIERKTFIMGIKAMSPGLAPLGGQYGY